ncbi:hypothetical protein BDW42DRAFT_193425 [Aspergillus taichungensis]|uniref:BTB domain-containing protein n=1 Tax=Aspergillus taichungensis TaxID=482145 RepID=A0A2J5HWW8_9EURO|nr:hypothetical protein BDW42DRAFT_193425 [Aspergillus taichungensis]
MEGTFGRFITSPLFTFQIGPEKKEFTVHSQPLAQLSDVLDKLINGNMLEAKTRRVDWSDVDEDTFVRLCEYAYLHDYTPPSSQEVSVCAKVSWGGFAEHAVGEQPPTPEAEPALESEPAFEPQSAFESQPTPVEEDQWGFGFHGTYSKRGKRRIREERLSLLKLPKPASPVVEDLLPYKEKSIWTRHLKDSFSSAALDATGDNTNQAREARFLPQANTQDQDFTPVFLGHARLYLLADKYMIGSLRQLALSKLAQTLFNFTLYRQSVPAVIECVRFVYAEKACFAFVTAPLRKLITSYVVSVLGQLGDDKRFEALLEEGGEFVADFWRAVWKAG